MYSVWLIHQYGTQGSPQRVGFESFNLVAPIDEHGRRAVRNRNETSGIAVRQSRAADRWTVNFIFEPRW
jgi:hypothetical protein